MTPSLKHNQQSRKPQTTQQNHTTGLFSKTGIKSLRRTALPLAAGLLLGGCVVASAVDLAATTVFTVGKIAVKTTGAVVDAVTKSGTNEFHGSLYGKWCDGDWFGKDPAGAKFKGFTEETNYGLTFGGPIIKDKLFFFVNYDKFHQGAPGADVANSPLGTGAISQTDFNAAITAA